LTSLARRALAELVGTALLVAGIVGSGIAATQLSPGDVGLQLLENTLATVGVLVAIILALGSVSGGHFNPAVTLADRALGGITTRDAMAYVAAQIVGACLGAMVANVMFEHPLVALSTKHRASPAHVFAEVVATFGLLLVILGVARSGRAPAAPYAVGAYIGGGYFFTSSTSVANPAVTIGRTLSDTFSGIAPASAPAFIAAQLLGGALAVACAVALYPTIRDAAANVVVPHPLPHPAEEPA
jgi:glycerol uptake facilitator-like aquaporin